jgi:hypothetical protein
MRRPHKIFPAHAGELANKLLGALAREHLVERFVDSYVTQFQRRGLKEHPARYRELLATLGREALLAMVAQVMSELPCYLAPPGRGRSAGEETQSAEAFSQEFLASLARASLWDPGEFEEFRRDLDLCAHLRSRSPLRKQRRKMPEAEGPFVDRCALLLDPSMLETGRVAAGKFLVDIERVTNRILTSVLGTRRRG